MFSVSFIGVIGEHGYSNDIPKMWPFFVARGPAFKRGLKDAKPFNTVDIYSLMCHVMRLDPAPHNGSLENVKHLFSNQENGEKSSTQLRGNYLKLQRSVQPCNCLRRRG